MKEVEKEAEQFLRTLYHEAGHVVMAIATGRSVNIVTADPALRTAGQCADPDYPDFSGRMEAEIISEAYGDNYRAQSLSWAAVLLAGPMAEAIKFGTEYGSASDIQAARAFISKPTNWERLIAKTEKELQARWPAVEALAMALIEQGQLTGEEARKIIEEATDES